MDLHCSSPAAPSSAYKKAGQFCAVKRGRHLLRRQARRTSFPQCLRNRQRRTMRRCLIHCSAAPTAAWYLRRRKKNLHHQPKPQGASASVEGSERAMTKPPPPDLLLPALNSLCHLLLRLLKSHAGARRKSDELCAALADAGLFFAVQRAATEAVDTLAKAPLY